MAIDGNSPRKSKKDEARNDDDIDISQEFLEDSSDDVHVELSSVQFVHVLQEPAKESSDAENDKHMLRSQRGLLEQCEEDVQSFLIQALGSSDSKVFDVLYYFGRVVHFKNRSTILHKGVHNESMFIITGGSAKVITSDSQVIRKLRKGDVFGDLSAVFGLSVTASVIAGKQTSVVVLGKGAVSELFKGKPALDVVDWCIRCHYLPTSDQLDSGRVYRRLTYEALQAVPVFHDWPENVLKQFIMSSELGLVTLFPKKSYLVMEYDPLNKLLVVVYGHLDIFSDNKEIQRQLKVSSHLEPFVFTEVGLLVKKSVCPLSIRAADICHVIQIDKGVLLRFLESHPKTENSFCERSRALHIAFKRMRHLLKRRDIHLQLELLTHDLRQLPRYRKLTAWDVMDKILSCNLKEIRPACEALEGNENNTLDVLMLVSGELSIALEDPSGQTPTSEYMNRSVFSQHTTRTDDDDRFILRAGDIVDLSKLQEFKVLLIAEIPSLVLKILKPYTVANPGTSNALEFV